ncbi:hypothetical protein [Spirochaeta cellobiosiphila]|uniref:hypothetical protein n=1 Tax=Spirochaeta cellobiosiphila TaxID=504483 RepID=UPI0004069A30|nr:hypothetical protein [Spirochaeta cellobiosiphila]
MRIPRILTIVSLFLAASGLAGAQDFGFGDTATTDSSSSSTAPAVEVSGKVTSSTTLFADNFDSIDEVGDASIGDLFTGELKFSATGSNVDGVIDLDVNQEDELFSINEAYLTAYYGKLDVETGIKKIIWGKADSDGPLSVINPVDYSDMTVTDNLERRIGVPLLHMSYALGMFSKLEGVFVPYAKQDNYDESGVWKPGRIALLESYVADPSVTVNGLNKDTSTLQYSQGGVRFTTTVGTSDIGFQYYYGVLTSPSAHFTSQTSIDLEYNRYHQIGADYASVWAGFNVRAELAGFITEDLDGDDGAVKNPFLVGNFGFDRDLWGGVNLNLQGDLRYRLMDDQITDNASDSEYDTDLTKTTIRAKLNKKFNKDEFETKLTTVYEVEDADYYIIPGFVWSKGETELEAVYGIFGGDEDGQLGYYDNNDYFKISLSYSF